MTLKRPMQEYLLMVGKPMDLIKRLKSGLETDCVVRRLLDDRPGCCDDNSPLCHECPVAIEDHKIFLTALGAGRTTPRPELFTIATYTNHFDMVTRRGRITISVRE